MRTVLTWEDVGEHVNRHGRLPVVVTTLHGERPGLADSTTGLLVDGQWIPRPVLDLMGCVIRRADGKWEVEEL